VVLFDWNRWGSLTGIYSIALKTEKCWLFYVADAYYLRVELTDSTHPVNILANMRADDNNLRIETLNKIRKLINEHTEIEVFGYHDIEEFEIYESNNTHGNISGFL
jgi:hypothetical protein